MSDLESEIALGLDRIGEQRTVEMPIPRRTLCLQNHNDRLQLTIGRTHTGARRLQLSRKVRPIAVADTARDQGRRALGYPGSPLDASV